MVTEFVDLVGEASAHRKEFLLWPDRWRSYTCKTQFNWHTFKFDQDNQNKIPNKPGIYGFLVQPNIAKSLNASYLFYIGKTERPLRKRFTEYLYEKQNILGRPKLRDWLNRYNGFVYFTCAEIDSTCDFKFIEEALLEAFLPPANAQFPTTVSNIIRAFDY